MNVAQWSQDAQGHAVWGQCRVSHMVIDRRTHQILVSSQSANNGQILQAPGWRWPGRRTRLLLLGPEQ